MSPPSNKTSHNTSSLAEHSARRRDGSQGVDHEGRRQPTANGSPTATIACTRLLVLPSALTGRSFTRRGGDYLAKAPDLCRHHPRGGCSLTSRADQLGAHTEAT